MNIETFVLCDAATDSQGKLNILGAFDTIFAPKTPVVHPSCAIALRVRFNKLEEGDHKMIIDIIDEDGKKIIPPMDGGINVRVNEGSYSSVVNLVLNIHRLKIDKFGEYLLSLAVDGRKTAELPLFIRMIRQNAQSAGK